MSPIRDQMRAAAAAMPLLTVDEATRVATMAIAELVTEHETVTAALLMRVEGLKAALRPFADFAPGPGGKVPRDLVITLGSPMAKRQLTMGDCYDARAALAAGGEQ